MIRMCLVLCLALVASCTSAQQRYSTQNTKLIKWYEQANESIKSREFEKGIETYKKCIKKDATFSEPYWRLGQVYSFLAMTDSAFSYFDRYWQNVEHSRVSYRNAIFLASQYLKKGDYVHAIGCAERAEELKPNLETDQDRLLVGTIRYGLKNRPNGDVVKPEELPLEINRFYTQYFPALTIDGQSLIFTKRDGGTIHHDEDLMISHLEDGSWTEAESLSKQINSRYNEGACTISADGRTLFFTMCEDGKTYGSCDIFISRREGLVWSRPKNLGKRVNSPYWDSQPSTSADGNTLYFSSNRPGGFGKRDIWMTRFDGRSWSPPKNLGATINTFGDEATPYIHVNNENLIFASNGRVGFGGYDLLITEKVGKTWRDPINMGGQINDHLDQLSFVITADGHTGYYAHEYENAGKRFSKLVRFDLDTDTLIAHTASYVTGRVRDAETNRPLKAKMQLFDLEANDQLYSTFSDSISGNYFIALTQGKTYGAYVTAMGYLFEDYHFETNSNSALRPDTINIMMTPIEVGASLVLENIYFEHDSYELDSKSESELNTISEFLRQNQVNVRIEGHTDQVGAQEYNRKLSENRAKSVYIYLINTGVDPRTLKYEGFGSEKPLFVDSASNEKNRRIEFVIESITNK